MKKSNKVLISIIVILLIAIAGFSVWLLLAFKTNDNSAPKKETTVEKIIRNGKNKILKPKNSNNEDNNADSKVFLNKPWNDDDALAFLQKVNDSSPQGKKYINEQYVNYNVAADRINHFPGNSIFVLGNNKSGVGDGGIVLTKNPANNTVTLTIGGGAESIPLAELIVDPATYKVIAVKQIHTDKNIMEYFGIKNPDDDSSDTNDNSDDSQSDDNDSSDSNDDNSDQQDNSDDDSTDNDDSTDTNDDDSDESVMLTPKFIKDGINNVINWKGLF